MYVDNITVTVYRHCMYVEIINVCYIWEGGIEIYVMLMVTLITVSKRDTGFSVVVTDSRGEGSLR